MNLKKRSMLILAGILLLLLSLASVLVFPTTLPGVNLGKLEIGLLGLECLSLGLLLSHQRVFAQIAIVSIFAALVFLVVSLRQSFAGWQSLVVGVASLVPIYVVYRLAKKI
jgi:hypothetical protein